MNGLIIIRDTANTGCVVPSDALSAISVAANTVVAKFKVVDNDAPTIDTISRPGKGFHSCRPPWKQLQILVGVEVSIRVSDC